MNFVQSVEDDGQVGPYTKMANEKEGNDRERKAKTEQKEVSQDFMDNLNAVMRMSWFLFISRKKL